MGLYNLRPDHLSAWRQMTTDGDLVLPALDVWAEVVPLVVFDVDDVAAKGGARG